MAKTTFSGPVYSKNGFINTGPGMTVSLTADTSLTVAAHAGRILLCSDADGKFTLPTINVSSNSSVAGDTDYNNPNNIGASFFFFVETAASDMDILTDGTDRFVGAVIVAINDGAKKAFTAGGSDDVMTLNGGTKGGLAGSVVTVTAIDDDKYLVHNSLLLGTATIATPFATA